MNLNHSSRSELNQKYRTNKSGHQYFYLEENLQTVKREIETLKIRIENISSKGGELNLRRNKLRYRSCGGYFGIILIMISVIILMLVLIMNKVSMSSTELLVNDLLSLLFP
jgi:hypothetical protein